MGQPFINEGAEPRPVSSQLLEVALREIRAYTRRRHVAIYPISLRTVAVNDGSHINVCPCEDLHERLQNLLGKDTGLWLLVDTDRCSARQCTVAEAYKSFELDREDDE